MNHDRDTILSHLKTIEYIWVGCPIRKWFGGKVIGWNVCASSIMRKPYTLERLKEEIESENLPLKIKDENDMLNSFQVFLK